MTALLEGRTALVTGGTLGIGFGIATQLREHGAQVVVTGLTDDECGPAREAGFTAHVLDVRDGAACRRVINTVAEELGGLSVPRRTPGCTRRPRSRR